METKWIEDFVTLAEVRNFTKAAELRNLSQAAFSRRIQSLEHWLGGPLIDRSSYPLTLTSAGEQFHIKAVNLLNQIADVKAEIGISPSRNHLRIATPYTIATTWLPDWWKSWSNPTITCSVDVGNVHDTVSSLNSGSADILICFHEPSNPIQLDLNKFDHHIIGQEIIKPYISNSILNTLKIPGTPEDPVPLLMYSPAVYFARVVETAIENASQKLYGYRAFEAGMTDVLGDLAEQGLGIAWLPSRSFHGEKLKDLTPVGNGMWDITVSLIAYRARFNTRPAVSNIWDQIVKTKI